MPTRPCLHGEVMGIERPGSSGHRVSAILRRIRGTWHGIRTALNTNTNAWPLASLTSVWCQITRMCQTCGLDPRGFGAFDISSTARVGSTARDGTGRL